MLHLDYIFKNRKKSGTVSIEVKAGNTASVSLNTFIKDFSPNIAYNLIGGRNGDNGVKYTLPNYMVMFL